PDIIKRHGYPVETYEVVTEDGYILTTFRIPYGKNPTSKKQPGKPVLLQHGMATNSGAFIIRNEKSLGFILADAGYDVWLGNFRGSRYSKSHIYLKSNESEFWDFTFHEIGTYDLPAQLNLIYKNTNKKVIYIGYSMGATSAYVYSSVHAKDALDKVKIFINLAPPVFVHYASLPFEFASRIWPILKLPLRVLTNGEISPRPLPDILLRLFCSALPFQIKMCQFSEMLLFGIDYEQADPETLPITFQQNSDLVSIKALTHYLQLVLSDDFYHFDYGNTYNMQIYGSPSPPIYNLSKVQVPSYTFVGKNDLSATKENVYALDKVLREEGKVHHIHVVDHENFNHFDFLTAKDITSLLYDHILNLIRQL
ncbi:hypothetical protein ILUMI_13300, partial [Ignelater luminosus]